MRPPSNFFSARALFSLSVVTISLLGSASARAEPADSTPAIEDVALAIVLDTSGSMNELIASSKGTREPKHLIARRALSAITQRLDVFVSSPSEKSAAAPRQLSLGLYVFRGESAVAALPLAAYNGAALRDWLDQQPAPRGATPLGAAIELAGRSLLSSAAAHKHILVLTDGANSTGTRPEAALDHLKKASQRKAVPIFTHVIALDISPGVFRALQSRGVTLIGASDEKQLHAQFDFILENRILLEAQ
jgi:hypothetical protein